MTQVVGSEALAELTSYPRQRYENIDLDRLTAYGVHVLDSLGVRPTFEYVVVALFRLFPDKFALVGFPQFPDAARVNRALLHCLPKYRNYLSGRAQSGYRLTNSGLGAAEETQKLLEADSFPEAGKRQRATAPRSIADNFMRDVRSSEAFDAFLKGDLTKIGRYELLRVLHAGTETEFEVLSRRMRELKRYAEQVESTDVARFLAWASAQLELDGA